MKNTFKNIFYQLSLIFISMVMVSCGNTDNSETKPSTNEVNSPSLENDMKSTIAFKDKDGKTFSINDFKGKVVFINFWATWCPPCIHEMPSIEILKNNFKQEDDIVFLMVDIDNKMEKSNQFIADRKLDLPVYVPVGNIPSQFLGAAIPTTVILDKSGEMVVRLEGARDFSAPEIIKAVKDLVEN